MLDLTVIILTYNEELHIRRALENVCPIAKEVTVIDCFSTDKTEEICGEFLNVKVVKHKWPGNQAEQFNWALDNVEISTKWVLRLDADEYLTHELISELENKLSGLDESISAVVLPLGRAFMGRVLKHGIANGVKMIRLFRYGDVRYEERIMDEHLQVLKGSTISFDHKFIDDNRSSLKQFIDKHNGYSSKEAAQLLDAEYRLIETSEKAEKPSYCEDVEKKRAEKERYAKMPLFWRSFAYFCYRRYFKLGFLDGKEGFLWDFFQGLWYRMLVDAKVYEVKKNCKGDKTLMKTYIKKHFDIDL